MKKSALSSLGLTVKDLVDRAMSADESESADAEVYFEKSRPFFPRFIPVTLRNAVARSGNRLELHLAIDPRDLERVPFKVKNISVNDVPLSETQIVDERMNPRNTSSGAREVEVHVSGVLPEGQSAERVSRGALFINGQLAVEEPDQHAPRFSAFYDPTGTEH